MIEAGTAPTDDLQALLGMSEEDLAQLPPEAYSQVQEMLQQAQEAAKAAEQQRQQLVQGLGQRIIGVYQ